MRLISIGRIYLLKSSEAERCILPDDAHRKPPARIQNTPSSLPAPKGAVHNLDTWRISKNTTHMFQYCSAKVPLRFSASNAPLHRHPLAFAHAQNALSYLPVSKNIPSNLSAPKASLVFARTQSGPSRLSASRALLCFGRAQSDPLRWPVSKSPS
mgnify:CR=1 FL=1